MATLTGTHVEIAPGNGGEPIVYRTFSSEVNALRSAVKNGNGYAFVLFGETLREALARIEAASPERLPEPPAAPRTRGKKTLSPFPLEKVVIEPEVS